MALKFNRKSSSNSKMLSYTENNHLSASHNLLAQLGQHFGIDKPMLEYVNKEGEIIQFVPDDVLSQITTKLEEVLS